MQTTQIAAEKVTETDQLLTDQGFKPIAVIDWYAGGIKVLFNDVTATTLTYGTTVTVAR